jgi:hypothetical protein
MHRSDSGKPDRGPIKVGALIALVVALAISASACSGGGDHGADPQRTLYGFNEDPVPGSYALQAELAMPVRRFKVTWSTVEPSPGRWSFSQPDAEYRAIRAHGLRPLILAVGAPCWATASATPCYGVPDRSHDRAWAAYIRRIVERYGGGAVGLEVWNEPNAVRMFPPHPDPARYAALLEGAYRAAKAADPRLPVISGGLLPSAVTTPSVVADGRFLAGIYAAGAKGSLDGIGAHPYPIVAGPGGRARYDLAAFEADLQRLRSVSDAADDSASPIWITEMGVSTASGGGFAPAATEAEQARYLLAMVRAARNDGDVRVALIHRLVDISPAIRGPLARLQSGFGVFNSNRTPKLAACDLSHEFGGSLSC